MKILLVAAFADSVMTFRGDLIRAWLKDGAEVHVAAPCENGGDLLAGSLAGLKVSVYDIPLRRTGMNPFLDAWLVVRLFFLMRKIRPDVVLGYTIKPVVYGSMAAFCARVPTRCALVTGLGFAFIGQRRLLGGFAKQLYRIGLKCTQIVFFQNPDDAGLFASAGIVSDSVKSVVVNGSGVDLELFPTGELPPGPTSFLMICRLLGNKGVREYVESAGKIKRLHPEVTFELAGWIDDGPDSIPQEELDAWQGSGVIKFLGRLDDVREAVQRCTVYVLPSYREGTPRTVLEAMAMGRPIITTDAPGCRQTVISGENGFLVPPRSVGALAEAMLRMVRTPELAIQMGKRSREIAEEKYDVHKVNEIMLHEIKAISRRNGNHGRG